MINQQDISNLNAVESLAEMTLAKPKYNAHSPRCEVIFHVRGASIEIELRVVVVRPTKRGAGSIAQYFSTADCADPGLQQKIEELIDAACMLQ